MARIIFRADGGPSIGSGHVMRCLALASSFAEGGWRIGFAASAETVASVAALARSGYEVAELSGDAAEEPDILARRWPDGTDVFVVDHYERDARFEKACRGWAKRIVALDDLANRPHEAEVVVDPGNAAEAYREFVPARCTVLAGPAYAIIHPGFRAMRGEALDRRDGRPVERVLLSFGQVDAPDATTAALDALDAAGFKGTVDIAIGSAAPHVAALKQRTGARVKLHMDTDRMPELMAAADLAIGAGGGTAWERCCLGLATIMVEIADNQRPIIAAVTAAGAGVSAGEADSGVTGRIAEELKVLLSDAGRRRVLSAQGARLVDGRGSLRILCEVMGGQTARDGAPVTLRPAELSDEGWLLELQCKPETRQHSNDPRPPTEEGHRRWFAATLDDPSRRLMIVDYEGRRAGMLRLDLGADAARVSIAIDPALQRLGLAVAALALAARCMPGRPLTAEILPENQASMALFAAAGYRQVSPRLFRYKAS